MMMLESAATATAGGVDWGDVPTWVAAVSATMAAVFTGGALYAQRKQLNDQRDYIRAQQENLSMERKSLAASLERTRRDQASRISVTHLRAHHAIDAHTDVANGSQEPIFDIEAIYPGGDDSEAAWIYCQVIGQSDGLVSDERKIEKLPAGLSLSFRTTLDGAGDDTPWVRFSDANGVRWERSPEGDLREVCEGQAAPAA